MLTTSPDRRLDYLSAGIRPWILLLLLSLALFLPGIATLPPVDRDESRYAQATRQMLESGDFLRIRFQDEARNKKPVGVYWLQAAVVSLISSPASAAIWPYRLVSVFAATSAVILAFIFGSGMFDRRTGLAGAALLASTLDLVVEAHLATTDAVQLPLAISAQGILALTYLGSRRGETPRLGLALLFWVAEGAAVLVKGPVVPGLSLLTVLALGIYERRWRWVLDLRPAFGIPLLLAIILPWLILIEIATGGGFLRDSVGHDLVGKILGGQESHGAPPFYYLALLPVTFWPGSLLLGATVLWAWRTRRLPASRFLIAWIVPFWILLELVPTKLPHYILPLYPALALASARAIIVATEDRLVPPPAWLRRMMVGIWALVGLLLVGGSVALALYAETTATARFGAALIAASLCLLLGQAVLRDRGSIRLATLGFVVLAGLAFEVPVLALVLPAVDGIWPSRTVARLVEDTRRSGERVSATGYSEPSLIFLLGTSTQLLRPEGAAQALSNHSVALSIVEAADDNAFRAALVHPPELIGTVSGLDYSNGRTVTLSVYRLSPSDGSVH